MATATESGLDWLQSQAPDAQLFLTWAAEHPELKVVTTDVSSEIIPPSLLDDVKLHDIRVWPSRGRKTDDEVYASDDQVRNRVARGNCVLTGSMKIGGIKKQIAGVVAYALKKFTGGMGDEDENEEGGEEETWKRFFLRPIDEATTVVSTTKENGASAHLAAIQLGDKMFIIAGSKNVHLIVEHNRPNQLALYIGDRFGVAKKSALAAFALFKQLGSERAAQLLRFLADSHLTCCFELIDPDDQHVEELPRGMTEPELRFFAFNIFRADGTAITSPNDCLCISPLQALRKATDLGLKVVDYEVVDLTSSPKALDNLMLSIRKLHGVEGKVLYFLDKDGAVLGLLKKKAVWYIIVRAVREKMKAYLRARLDGTDNATANRNKRRKPSTARMPTSEAELMQRLESLQNETAKRTAKRIREIQQWLSLSEETTEAWTALALGMNDWVADTYRRCLQGKTHLDKEDPTVAAFRHKLEHRFPEFWREYCEATGRSDRVDVVLK